MKKKFMTYNELNNACDRIQEACFDLVRAEKIISNSSKDYFEPSDEWEEENVDMIRISLLGQIDPMMERLIYQYAFMQDSDDIYIEMRKKEREIKKIKQDIYDLEKEIKILEN